MKRQPTALLWCILLILVANLPGLRQVMANAPLRTDTDTVAMLDAMRNTGGLQGWWQWFTGDWFLQNGFYRPTTCLSLLLDYTLYGEAGWGYRLTNWLLAVLTALGAYAVCFWFARRWLSHWLSEERFQHLFALALALALSLQQTNALHTPQGWSAWWLVGAWLVWVNRSRTLSAWMSRFRSQWWGLWLAVGAFFWGWDRLVFSDFERLIVWVPSRTALLSTCLAVWGMWMLVRWGDTGKSRFLLGTGLLYAGSCGAYEQPLMMVPLALVLAFAMRRQWGWRGWMAAGLILAIAVGVLALRFALLPASPSGYQQQQLRSAPLIGLQHLLETVLPVAGSIRYWKTVGLDPYLFFVPDAWNTLMAALAFLGVLAAARRSWRWFGWWLLWHGLTYLPMSLLHPFEHYHYLPQIGQNALDAALMAWGLLRLQHTSLPNRDV